MSFTYRFIFILLAFGTGRNSVAQSVGAKTDKTSLLIGERIQYDLMIQLPAPGFRINFNLPDSVPHFEVIANANFDTVSNKGGAFLIHKKITLTSFDSGSWQIPAFEVFIQRDNQSRRFVTEPILMEIGYSPSDSTNQLRDIKPVMEVSVRDYFWVYVAAIVLGLLIIGYLVYRYIRNRPKKPVPLFHSSLSPYEEAMKALEQLKQHNMKNPPEIKSYHTALTDIFKRYYSRRYGNNLLNKTTGDILLSIKETQGDSGLISKVAEVFRCADAVKFAKFIPAAEESRQRAMQVQEAISAIDKEEHTQKT